MDKKLISLQEDKYDCAAACLSSIIKYYNGYLPLEDIRNLIKTDKSGTNAYDLISGAKEVGFDAIGKKMNLESLITQNNLLPLIAHVKKENFYHFVVVYKIDVYRKQLVIMDPSIGFVKTPFKNFKTIYLETVILFSKVRKLPSISKENRLLKVIIKSLFEDKRKLFLIITLSIVIFLFSLIEIYLYKYFIDKVSFNSFDIKIFVSLMLSFIAFKNMLDYLKNRLFIKTKRDLELKINKETIKRVFCLPREYYKNKSTGEIVSRINDLDLLKDLFLELIMNLFVNVLLVISCLIIMYFINDKLFLISIISIIIFYLLTFLYNKTYKKEIRILEEDKGIYTNTLIEYIEGIETVNNLNISEKANKQIENKYTNYINDSNYINKLATTQRLLKNGLFDLSNILVLLVSFKLSLTNHISIGQIMIIYMLFNYLISAVKNLLDKALDYTMAFDNLEKVNSILVQNNKKQTDEVIKGTIVIKSLTYSNNYKTIIDNLNITINSKSKIFIKGKSGSGKTTLLKIILKHINDYKGAIFINGVSLKNVDSKVIDNSITYISQNEKLFSKTLIDNLVLERSVDKENLNKVIEICRLRDLIEKRKLKEDFFIEEGGFNLSGGERQRIILARGLLKESKYLFIDEALSEVDLNLEKEIMKDVLNEYKDKTILYVSHKEEVKELFDEIYDVERRRYV